jgi:asparagine synthase (glutamine-hydrolysing)
MRGILPEDVITRPKHGFGVPLGRWFRGRLAPLVRDLLLSETSRRRGILDAAAVELLLDRHRRGRPLDLPLWTLISLELWCRTFLDARPRAERLAPPPGDSAARRPAGLAG